MGRTVCPMATGCLNELKRRGLLAAFAGEQAHFVSAIRSGPAKASVYAGFDPTASSLHVGHLVSIAALRHLKRSGLRRSLWSAGSPAWWGILLAVPLSALHSRRRRWTATLAS